MLSASSTLGQTRPSGPPTDLITILHRLGEGLLVTDHEGQVTQASTGAARLLRRPVADLVGLPCPLVEPPAAATAASALPNPRRRPHGSNAPRRWVTRVLDENDSERCLLVSKARIRGGHVLSLVDVTEANLASSINDAVRQLNAARELTGIAVWEWDIASDTLRWSTQMFALFGMPPDATAPSHSCWHDWMHPDDRPGVEACEREALERGEAWQSVFRVTAANGVQRHLRNWCDVERATDGTPLKVIGATLDVTETEAAASELIESRRRLDAAARLAGLASWSMGLDGSELWWSDTMYALYGITDDQWEPSAEGHVALIHRDDRDRYTSATTSVVMSGEPEEITLRIVTPAGDQRYLLCSIDVTCNRDGEPTGIWGTALDVSDEERARYALEHSREELRMAFDEAPTGMMLATSPPGGTFEITRSNRVIRQMFGVSDSGVLTLADMIDRLPEGDLARVRTSTSDLLAGRSDRVDFGFAFHRPDGSLGYASVRAGITRGAHGSQLLFHVIDMTTQHRAQEELQRLALTDTITGLSNRAHFEARLRDALAHVEPGRRAVAMILLDLDRFKVVNDSLGHVTGDNLLVAVARRLEDVAPSDACIARLGGDEFALIIDPAPGASALLGLAHLMRERLAKPYSLDNGHSVVCTASIGVTRVDDPSISVEDVYRQADLALYEAKDHGRNGCAMSDEHMRARADERIAAEHRLRGALEADGVRIHLQPIVRFADGQVEGAEALVRLEHPTHGLLMPGQFIEVAEDTGLVVEIDVRVAELAIAYLATMATDDRWVAVNASPRTLAQPQYTRRVKAALAAFSVSPSRLHVEVTESSLLDEQSASTAGLAALRACGVKAGIDDFGTGYSALAYLDRFALDFLKIDKSFVARLATCPVRKGQPDRAESVVSAIVALAHVYGMKVTAEGVETQAQADALRRVGCDRGQGYLFGFPSPTIP